MSRMYMLDDHGKPVLVGDSVDDVRAWSAWWIRTAADRVLACVQLDSGVTISTVFMAFDERDENAYPDEYAATRPLLWQTKIFGGPMHGKRLRYASARDAWLGHGWWVAIVVASENQTSRSGPEVTTL